MKIETLEAFIHVAKRQNITRSAAETHTSQPSLSMRIAALEKEIGCTLFRRSNSGLELTESGEAFLEYAQQIVGLYHEALTRARAARHSEPVRISIELPGPRLNALRSIDDPPYRVVDLDINTFEPDAVIDGTLDVAATLDYAQLDELRAEASAQGLTYLPLGSSPAFLTMMKTHPLASKETLMSEDLDGCIIVVNSTAYFDHYSKLLQHIIGPGRQVTFRMRPSTSLNSVAYADFKDALYICGSASARTILGQRPDVVVHDTLDGAPLMLPSALICRTKDYESPYSPVGQFVRKFLVALGAPQA